MSNKSVKEERERKKTKKGKTGELELELEGICEQLMDGWMS